MQINTTDIEGGKTLYTKIRAGFLMQGDSLNAWCRRSNYHLSNVREALHGFWDGPRGRIVRQEAVLASGLNIGEKNNEIYK